MTSTSVLWMDDMDRIDNAYIDMDHGYDHRSDANSWNAMHMVSHVHIIRMTSDIWTLSTWKFSRSSCSLTTCSRGNWTSDDRLI